MNVGIPFDQSNVASRDKRLWAYLLDMVPITVAVFLLHYYVLGFDDVLYDILNNGQDENSRAGLLSHRNRISNLSFAIWVVYSSAMEASGHQATIGKKALGIKVVDANGHALTHNKAIWRNVSKFLSAIVLGMGFIWILFDKTNQGWHDKIASTYVVNKSFEAPQS